MIVVAMCMCQCAGAHDHEHGPNVYCIHFKNQIVFIPAKTNSFHGSNITKFRHEYKQYTVATITYMHSIINNFIFHEATATMAICNDHLFLPHEITSVRP